MKYRLQPFILAVFCTVSPFSWSSSQLQQDINELNRTIQEKSQSRDSFQESLQASEIQTRDLRSDLLSLDIEIKQLNREERKIESMAGPTLTETEKAKLSTVKYKRRVAEINEKKKQTELDNLLQEKDNSAQRVNRLGKLIINMEQEMAELRRSYKAGAIEQARQLQQAKAKAQADARKKQLVKEKRQRQVVLAAKQQADQAALEKKQQAHLAQKALMTSLPAATKKALNKTKAKAKKTTKGEPALGNTAILEVANPVGSTPKLAAKMSHMGNHQYMATIKVAAGRQHFIIGGFKFTQDIPQYKDGKHYLVLIDASKPRPIFQMLTAGK